MLQLASGFSLPFPHLFLVCLQQAWGNADEKKKEMLNDIMMKIESE